MFEDALLESSSRRASGLRRINYLLGYVAESIVVGVLVLVPLISTQALPRQWLISELHIPSPPPGPPPGRPAGRPVPPARRPAVDQLAAPVRIPPTIAVIVETPEPPQLAALPQGPFVPGSFPGGGSGNGYVPGSVPWGTEALPPPPPVVHATPKRPPYRVGGDVIAARAIYQPRPDYPPLARIARIQGTVVLQATLARDGTIQDLKVISGPPLLVQAALAAVKTWRYQPTLLNSEPVEVLTEIDVTFTLGE